jgi:hypothetical protein
MKIGLAFTAAFFTAISAFPAHAATQLTVENYATPNGGTGTFRYWDTTYDGDGNTAQTGALLSGGTGDLTDGVVADLPWDFAHSTPTRTGPYVGWWPSQTNGLNPTISFDFGTDVLVNKVRIHVDNVGRGRVRAPSMIKLSNISQTPLDFSTSGQVPSGAQGWIEIDNLSLSGSTLDMQLFQGGRNFVMVSEIEFFGVTSAVPEPATWLMMILGFGCVGASMRAARRLERVCAFHSYEAGF